VREGYTEKYILMVGSVKGKALSDDVNVGRKTVTKAGKEKIRLTFLDAV